MTARTILLVEDNADDAELTIMAFAKHDATIEVVHIADGEQALEYMFAQGPYSTPEPPVPAVVLLDLNLPRVPGLRILELLRAHPRSRRVPVVVLTSSNEDTDVTTAYELGANSFVRKPVDYERFVAAARQLGLYWLVLNERAER